MKVSCKCGIRISDTGCEQDNKGRILKSGIENSYQNLVSDALSELVIAFSKGQTRNWIEQWHPEALAWNVDWSDASEIKSLIDDFICEQSGKNCVAIYQCKDCGRILIQKSPKSFGYTIFTAESPERDVLSTHDAV